MWWKNKYPVIFVNSNSKPPIARYLRSAGVNSYFKYLYMSSVQFWLIPGLKNGLISNKIGYLPLKHRI
jgi:hypothetical protein